MYQGDCYRLQNLKESNMEKHFIRSHSIRSLRGPNAQKLLGVVLVPPGKTCCRGSKGQTSVRARFYAGSKAARAVDPPVRQRGFTSKFQKVYQTVSLTQLATIKAETITPEVM
jgi:hypothetical protein